MQENEGNHACKSCLLLASSYPILLSFMLLQLALTHKRKFSLPVSFHFSLLHSAWKVRPRNKVSQYLHQKTVTLGKQKSTGACLVRSMKVQSLHPLTTTRKKQKLLTKSARTVFMVKLGGTTSMM